MLYTDEEGRSFFLVGAGLLNMLGVLWFLVPEASVRLCVEKCPLVTARLWLVCAT